MYGHQPTYTAAHRRQEGEEQVYAIGRYEVHVRFAETDPERAVRFSTGSGRAKESGPHVEIHDGQVTVDLFDLLEMALLRTPPEEIVVALWRHAEVRQAFCETFIGDTYSEGDSDWDALRRSTLERAGVNLTERRLNKVANALRSAEYYEKKYWELYHARCWLRDGALEVKRPDFLPKVTIEDDGRAVWVQEDPEHKIGSEKWVEARDWWRARLVGMMEADTPDTADKPDNVRGVRSALLTAEA